MDSLDISLLSHLQEYGQLDTRKSDMFGRSENSIYRRIESINLILPEHLKLVIKNHIVYSRLTYKDYIQVVQKIPFYEYVPSQEERLSFIIVQSILKEVVNTSRLYQHLGFSAGTKKKDNRKLSVKLKEAGLEKEIVRKKGIRVSGQETFIRIEGTKILMNLLELGEGDNLYLRKANNPMETLIAEYFKTETTHVICKTEKVMREISATCKLELSYPSKKFIYIYLTLMFYRNDLGFHEDRKVETNVEVQPSFRLIDHPLENHTLTNLLLSMDTMNRRTGQNIRKPFLESKISGFIDDIQKNIITFIHSRDELSRDIYQFIFKCTVRKVYGFNFYDKKLDGTSEEFPELFSIIAENPFISEELQLSDDQVSTLTLIFRKHIIENKVLGRNTKNIVMVTNSSIEKADFFSSNLNHYLDIRIVKTLHINELHQLEKLEYDHIITFSNRIAMLIEGEGFECIKLNYHFRADEVKMLLDMGFSSSSRRKILAGRLMDSLEGMEREEAISYLIREYPSHFL